jgi:hypothetical protein
VWSPYPFSVDSVYARVNIVDVVIDEAIDVEIIINSVVEILRVMLPLSLPGTSNSEVRIKVFPFVTYQNNHNREE